MEYIINKKEIVLTPSEWEWESHSVLNPTLIEHNGKVHIFYRAVKENNYSSIGHGIIQDGKIIPDDKPIIVPTLEEEIHGVEDPRITKIDDLFYLLYTAWDGDNARIGLAISKDLINFEKQGIVSPNLTVEEAINTTKSKFYKYKWNQQRFERGKKSILWDKDAILLPEKIDGKFVMLHRLNPSMQIVKFENFLELKSQEFWKDYIENIEEHTLLHPELWWESSKIGGGAVPLKIDEGYLFIYHGRDLDKCYRCGALLLDEKLNIIKRTKEPFLVPEEDWEINGVVDRVVFAEGLLLKDDKLEIYYGAADKLIGRATLSLKKLLELMEGI